MKSVLSLAQCVALVRALLGGMSIAGAARFLGVRASLVRAQILRLGEGCRALHNAYLGHLDVLSVRLKALLVQGKKGRPPRGKIFFAQATALKLMLGFRLSLDDSRDLSQLTELVEEVRARLSVIPFIRNSNIQCCEDAVRNVYGRDFEEGIVIPIRPELEAKAPEQKSSKWEKNLSRLLLGQGMKCGKAMLEAMAAIWMCFFNFCVRQKSTRCTPAEGLSIVSKPWSPEEMISIALRARAGQKLAERKRKANPKLGPARITDTGIWLFALPQRAEVAESVSNSMAVDQKAPEAPEDADSASLMKEESRIIDLAGYRRARVRASAKPPVKAGSQKRRWEQLALFKSD